MRTYLDAKAMAKSLRLALAQHQIELGHGQCLELVARQFECDNWNVLAAHIDSARPPAVPIDELKVPQGWLIAGSRPELYQIGIDETVRHKGRHPAVIRCILGGEAAQHYNNAPGFGTLMQTIKADAYRGQRVRLRGEMRCVQAGSAQMWMRIDSQSTRAIRFDNMDDRPLQGTRDWTPAEIVLDVPEDATLLNLGFFVIGPGQAWASGFVLDTVNTDHAQTGNRARMTQDEPTNLDFNVLAAA